MRRIAIATITMILLTASFDASSVSGGPAFSRETRYIVKRQFDAEPSALSGAWRWVPAGVAFSEDSVSAFLVRSFGPDSVKEIGRMRFWDKNYIVAVVLPKSGGREPEVKKHFVFFNEDRPVSYKIFDYNSMRLVVPPAVSAATAVNDACTMVQARLERYPHSQNLLSVSPAADGRRAPGCEISFQGSATSKSGSPEHAFLVQGGDELFQKGWMQDTRYASDGDGATSYGMRNERVRCLFDWKWNQPEEGKDTIHGRIRCLVE